MRWKEWLGKRPWSSPWPAGMVITVEDRPLAINLLLFVREAWGLAPDADIPKLSPVPETGHSAMPGSASGRNEWEQRWRDGWQQVLDGYRQEPDPLAGTLWTSTCGWEGLDAEAFNAWHNSLIPPFPCSAERDCLDALVPAWKSGLERVIVLPYDGFFAQRISARNLLISAGTRTNPEWYRRALALRL
jgi:hypothetical protein